MKIVERILTNNSCYKAFKFIVPKKIMLHSTAVKGAPAKNFISSWNVPAPGGKKVCVHAFVDPDVVYQTLPWTMRAWHCGGTGNNVAIGFELCEPKDYADKDYFEKIKHTAIELCAFLCKQYNLTSADVTSHCEASKMYGTSFASNHSDLDHWWKKYFSYTMKDFRKELSEFMKEEENMVKYETIEEIPNWGKKSVQKAIELGILKGTGSGLGLTETELKVLVWMDRAKIFE